MSKHTPGPWEVDSSKVHTAVNAGNKHIAMVNYIGTFTLEEHTANAHLIAAAPELLEALHGLVDSIQSGDDYPESAAPLDQAIKAIAKAEGMG